MDVNALAQELEQGDAAGVYLLLGQDAAERSRALALIHRHLVDPEFAEWCTVSLDGADSTGREVLEAASTPPFIGDRRVVVVRSAGELEDDEALAPYVESPAPFSVLILAADEIDKRRKLYQAIKKHGKIVEFHAPAAERLPQVVARLAGERNIRLQPDAVRVIIERAGDDMNRLRGELDKLAIFTGDGGEISGEEADVLVARGLPTLGQYAIFDFVDAVAEGKGSAALLRLDQLLRGGEPPLVVLTMIARQFRLLLAAIGWQGASPKALAKEVGLTSDFPAKKALAQARRWTVDAVGAALQACADCDLSMKRGVDGRLALETLTVALCGRIANQDKKRAAQAFR